VIELIVSLHFKNLYKITTCELYVSWGITLFEALNISSCRNKTRFYKIFVTQCVCEHDIHGSVHHSTIHKEYPTRRSNVSKFLLFRIYMKLNMFRATHRPSSQEPKTALAHCAWQRPQVTRPTTFHIRKTRGCQCSFRLL